MSLVHSTAWQHELLQTPPIKLEPELIVPPGNTELTFVGIEHLDGSNTDYLEELIRGSDILFPEFNSWDPLTAKTMQKISNGDFKARQKVLENGVSESKGYIEALVKNLYASRVTVRMADLPNTSPIPAQLTRIWNNGGLSSGVFPIMAERDKHIARTISSEITTAQNENPRFREKVIKATAIFGIGHLSVEAALSESARIHEVSTFSTRLLFDADAARATSSDVVEYNNWLRTGK